MRLADFKYTVYIKGLYLPFAMNASCQQRTESLKQIALKPYLWTQLQEFGAKTLTRLFLQVIYMCLHGYKIKTCFQKD